MLLILLLTIPLLAGVLCLVVQSPRWWERLNLAAFVVVAILSGVLGFELLEQQKVTALEGFLQADPLSGLLIGLTAFVALVCGIYAIGYFRRDLIEGRITIKQLRHYYVLTPLFVGAMLLVPMADNLGVMWVAVENTTLASVLP